MNKQEFLKKIYNYFNCFTSETAKTRYEVFKDELEKHNAYNFAKMFDDIKNRKYFGKFPLYVDIKDVLETWNTDILKKKNIAPNGEYRCKECRGLKGKLVDQVVNNVSYKFFFLCGHCRGVGRTGYDDIFYKFSNYENEVNGLFEEKCK